MRSKGFDRLRIVAVGVAGATLVPALAPGAHADTFPIRVHTSAATGTQIRGAHWVIGAETSGTDALTSGGSGFCLCSSITYYEAKTANPSHATFSTVAVHDFGTAQVAGHNYLPPEGMVHRTGETVTAGGKKTGGLVVSAQYDFALNATQTVRLLLTFKNPGRRTVRKTIKVGAGLWGQNITKTSDGDATLDASDAWYVNDALAAIGGVVVGRGDAGRGTPTHQGSAVIDAYRLKIKPHKTVRLLYFLSMTKSTALGETRGADFDDGAALDAAGLLAGLSAGTRAQVQNWTALPPA